MADTSSHKRRKLDNDGLRLQPLLESWLGFGGDAVEPPMAVQSILGKGVKIRQDLYQLQKLLDLVGFRTSIVQSPRLAVSLYKDSCILHQDADPTLKQQQDYMLTMLGVHPDQDEREACYKHHFREKYCSRQFLARLRFACPNAMKDPQTSDLIERNVAASKKSVLDVKQLMKILLGADTKLRQEQLDHELERVGWYNSTLSNALLQQYLHGYHSCIVKDVFFKTSHVAKYERITFYLYDPDVDQLKPSTNFILLPDLSRALQQPAQEATGKKPMQIEQGTRAIVQDMMATFWSHLLRHGGYYASATMKEQLSPALGRYFLSGLRQNPKVPLKL